MLSIFMAHLHEIYLEWLMLLRLSFTNMPQISPHNSDVGIYFGATGLQGHMIRGVLTYCQTFYSVFMFVCCLCAKKCSREKSPF